MRFYGGEPMTWLQRTPTPVVQACLTMLSRLEAEEAITEVNRAGITFGQSGEDGKALVRDWERVARGEASAPAGPVRPDPNRLRAAGIAVRRVRRRRHQVSA